MNLPQPSNQPEPHDIEQAETFSYTNTVGKTFSVTAPAFNPDRRGNVENTRIGRRILDRAQEDTVPLTTVAKDPTYSRSRDGRGNVSVVEGDSLNVARSVNLTHGRVAVLNMANAFNPGGGFFNGTRAQEEAIGRRTNMIPSLCQFEEEHSRVGGAYIPANHVLFTPQVSVYTDASGEPYEEPFKVDILSAAALQFKRGVLAERDAKAFSLPSDMTLPEPGDATYERYEDYTLNTIRNILATARAHEVRNVVLGAIGCGAFENNPLTVAEMFKAVIDGEGYRYLFNEIVFGILVMRDSDQANLDAFAGVFR